MFLQGILTRGTWSPQIQEVLSLLVRKAHGDYLSSFYILLFGKGGSSISVKLIQTYTMKPFAMSSSL